MIYIPKICGTCNGSNKALNLVYDIYEREIQKEKPKNIYIYKEILHNQKIKEEFESMGIKTIDNLDNITSNDIVIIRAHGESKDTYDYLNKNNIEYYDATCLNVSLIHEKILDKYQNGYEIIILGSSNHPEVIGSNGWCNNEGIIISDDADLDKITDAPKKFVICQTTFNKEKFLKLSNLIKERFSEADIIIDNSLCPAVSNICKSSVELAQKCDIMFVIGGSNSSNTEEIFKSVSEYTTSYKFSDIKDFYKFIKDANLNKEMNIGLTGGASTTLKEINNYKYLLEFWLFYQEKYQELKSNQHDFNQKLIDDSDNEKLKNILNDFIDLNQGGKYIRGVLIGLGEYLASDKDANYLNLAYAYETFQTSVLIHDDIIDNAKLRRGMMTIPRRVCHKYLNKFNDPGYNNDVIRLANSLGICTGDYGFYKANQIIIDNYKNHKNFSQILEFYNDIVIKTIKGEILDVILPFQNKYSFTNSTEDDILDIYHMKTSFYTIIGPFMLGMILGGKKISDDIINVLNKIGYAFQIKDDILGIFSDTLVTGKPNTSDIEEFKQTIIYSHIIKTSFKEEFLKYYGKKIGKKELEKIRKIIIQSGTYDYVNNYLEDIYRSTILDIDKLDLKDIGKDILKGLLIYINIREK